MGNTVYKPNPDKNFYVVWSDNTDTPMAWGTRSEVAQALIDSKRAEMLREMAREPERIEARFARADERITSSMVGSRIPKVIMYGNIGTVPLERVEEFLATYDPESGKFDESLVVPWEDN